MDTSIWLPLDTHIIPGDTNTFSIQITGELIAFSSVNDSSSMVRAMPFLERKDGEKHEQKSGFMFDMNRLSPMNDSQMKLLIRRLTHYAPCILTLP